MSIPTPISFWNFNESSGNAEDAVGTNDLINVNATAYAAGKISNGADFELSSSQHFYISDASQSGLDITGDMAVSFWYKTESTPINTTPVGKMQIGGTQIRSWRIYLNNDAGGTLYFTASIDGTPNTEDCSWSFAPSNGTWYHIVISYNSSTGTATLYINNSSQGADSYASITTFQNTAADFTIGASEGSLGSGSSYSDYVDGIIDAVGIWNQTLSSDNVAELYNSGSGEEYPFPSASSSISSSISPSTSVSNSISSSFSSSVSPSSSLSSSTSSSYSSSVSSSLSISVSSSVSSSISPSSSLSNSVSSSISSSISSSPSSSTSSSLSPSTSLSSSPSSSLSPSTSISSSVSSSISSSISSSVSPSSTLVILGRNNNTNIQVGINLCRTK